MSKVLSQCQFKHLPINLKIPDIYFLGPTLRVCNNEQQVKAHKVILSSMSSVFKRMFVNNPHPEPMVFLKGVDTLDLSAVLDFVYLGEATVLHDNFNSFLETAADLEIEELSSFSSENKTSNIRLVFFQDKTKSEEIEEFNNLDEDDVDVSEYSEDYGDDALVDDSETLGLLCNSKDIGQQVKLTNRRRHRIRIYKAVIQLFILQKEIN